MGRGIPERGPAHVNGWRMWELGAFGELRGARGRSRLQHEAPLNCTVGFGQFSLAAESRGKVLEGKRQGHQLALSSDPPATGGSWTTRRWARKQEGSVGGSGKR